VQEQIKVLIADDHLLVAKLINMMLKTSKDITVVGTVSDGNEVLIALGKMEVDVLLLDIDMPNLDGLQAISKICEAYPKVKIIMLSNHCEAWIIQKAIKSGALGYVTKYAEGSEVVEAITKVQGGQNYFCKTSFKNLMNKIANKEPEHSSDGHYTNLTARERDVLKLIVKELTTRQISDELSISIRTVETHRKNLLHKLGAKNTVGLIKAAMEANIIENGMVPDNF